MDEARRSFFLAGLPVFWLFLLFILASHCRFRALHQPPAGLFIYRFFNSFIISLTLFVPAVEPSLESEMWIQVPQDAAMVCATGWSAASLLEVSLIVWNPFRDSNTRRLQLHLLCWTSPVWVVIYWLVTYNRHKDEGMTSAQASSATELDSLDVVPWYALSLVVAELLVMVLVLFQLRNGLRFSAASRRKVIRQEIVLVVGFGLTDLSRIVGIGLICRRDCTGPGCQSPLECGSAAWPAAVWVISLLLDTQIWLLATETYCRWWRLCGRSSDETPSKVGQICDDSAVSPPLKEPEPDSSIDNDTRLTQ